MTTQIELTDEEARLFIEFQKRFALVKLLESIGALNMSNGSITIHFDSLGQIKLVDKQQHFRLP